MEEQVKQEILDHAKWCSPNCLIFIPESYREARLVAGRAAEDVQRDYDSCHMWR